MAPFELFWRDAGRLRVVGTGQRCAENLLARSQHLSAMNSAPTRAQPTQSRASPASRVATLPYPDRWCCSARSSAVLLHARLGVNPVHLPCFAAVCRKRLFVAARIRSEAQEGEAHQDRPVLVRFLVIEHTAPVFELTDQGRGVQYAAVAVGEQQVPLLGLRIVETQSQELQLARGALGLYLRQVGASPPNLAHQHRAVQRGPGVGTGERMQQPRHMDVPGAELPVEAMLLR